MNNYGERVSKTSIRFVRILPGPIERVWDYLTDPSKRALWLAGGETATNPGGDAVYEFDNQSLTPHEETVPDKYEMEGDDQTVSFTGKVLIYDKPHILKTTWPDSDGGDSIVTFTMTETDGEVRLEILHEDIPKEDEIIGASAGWHTHLDIMADRMAGKTPAPFWKKHTKLETEYADRY